jgi:hypothetical protein
MPLVRLAELLERLAFTSRSAKLDTSIDEQIGLGTGVRGLLVVLRVRRRHDRQEHGHGQNPRPAGHGSCVLDHHRMMGTPSMSTGIVVALG